MKIHERRKIAYLWLPVAVSFFLFLTSCSDQPTTPRPSPPFEILRDNMVMYTEQEEYPLGAQSITVFLENVTEEDVGHGRWFYVERLVDGTWITLAYKDSVAFDAVMDIVSPKGISSNSVNLYDLKEQAEAGRYRIKHVEQIYAEDEDGVWQVLEQIVCYAEFSLVAP